MSRGIIVFGASGSGQTTLGKELAAQLNFQHFDLDDYHWRWDTEIPYTIFRPAQERIAHLMADISKYPNFVMSGSMWSIRKSFEPMFDLGVFVTAPADIRAERVRLRVLARWGDKAQPPNDMLNYDTAAPSELGRKQHEQWITELPCPVVRVDGLIDPRENAAYIIKENGELLCQEE
ncbi:MAG: AAA family ATPase [Oscillospiraceae bacterium]|nr:AAA family ATPase [Oscillospiraceae bacterium]